MESENQLYRSRRARHVAARRIDRALQASACALLAAALLGSPAARAQLQSPAGVPAAPAAPSGPPLTNTIAVNGSYQYDSNVFELPSGVAVPGSCTLLIPCEFTHSDSDYTYGAAWNLGYRWRRQALHVAATGTEYRYLHFSRLNHFEYSFDGGWNGALGQVVSAGFDVRRTHTPLPFYEVISSSRLTVQTEQREDENLGFQFLPKWRFDLLGFQRTLNEPLVDDPNLKLSENDGGADLEFLGTGGLTAGIAGDYLAGNYSGVSAGFIPSIGFVPVTGISPGFNPSYRQTSGYLVVIYNHKTRSTFNGEFGYSRRTSVSGINTVSGATGHLDYTNQLTGKTSVTLGVARDILPYYFNAGSEIDTSGNFGVVWQATYRIGVTLGYSYTYAQLPGQGFVPGSARVDRRQFANLNIAYQATRILAIKPYAEIQTRASNLTGLDFNESIYGVQLVVQWQR